MESIERLRTYARGYELYVNHKLLDIADSIEREVEEHYVPLPLDADGIPIYVGDVVERTDPPHHPSEVMSMVLFCDGDWQVHIDERQNVHASYQPKLLRHHTPTVEDVLKDFIDAWAEWKDGAAMMNPIETFAAKLRLADEEE